MPGPVSERSKGPRGHTPYVPTWMEELDMAETRRDWEVVQENAQDKTERLKVLHGWLYRVVSSTGVIALTFVPGD